jgi:hypothetical protein
MLTTLTKIVAADSIVGRLTQPAKMCPGIWRVVTTKRHRKCV